MKSCRSFYKSDGDVLETRNNLQRMTVFSASQQRAVTASDAVVVQD